jgi:hypothetical protein
MENTMKFPQKTKMELQYDRTISLLGTNLKKMKSAYIRNNYISVSIAALLTKGAMKPV